VKGSGGTSPGTLTGLCSLGCSSKREQALDFFHRHFVGVGRAGRFVNRGVDEHGDGLRDAIEHQQLIRDDEIHGGRVEFVVRRTRDDGFDVVNEFVADEAHGAAGEAWQAPAA
jgi:hypothetical protein